VPCGPLLAWKRGDLAAVLQRLLVAGAASVLAAALAASLVRRGPWLAPFGIALGIWVIAGALSELAFRIKLGQASGGETWRRLVNLPRAALGTTAAHAGLGLTLIGIVATSAWQQEHISVMRPGDRLDFAGYGIDFRGIAPEQGPNYRAQVGLLSISFDGRRIELRPSRRLYDMPPQPTTEAGIYASWAGDLYAVLGDETKDDGRVIRLYFNPLVRLIWIGAMIMALGGALSLSDRRLRIGAPRRARAASPPVPAE